MNNCVFNVIVTPFIIFFVVVINQCQPEESAASRQDDIKAIELKVDPLCNKATQMPLIRVAILISDIYSV
jgi:hypothetical protein